MVKKEFRYRGHTLDELKTMSIEEFVKLLPARQRRSMKRGFTDAQKTLLKKVRKTPKDKLIRTHVRDMIIFPEFIGRQFAIHDGKDWNVVQIKPPMIGHYMGEFSITRERVTHSGPGIGATRGTKFISVK
jgi:small subunit ribosomal protein S19